jgi:hypothetical protein
VKRRSIQKNKESLGNRSPDHQTCPGLPWIIRSPDGSCYTSRFPLMLNAAVQRCVILLAVCFAAIHSAAQQEPGFPARAGFAFARDGVEELPSPWQLAADDLVQQVLSRAGFPSTVSLSFENLSSLSAADQASIKQAVMAGFHNSGVRMVKAELALASVDITLSEDWQNYVWVAEIKQGPGSQVVIKTVARPQKATNLRAPILTIRKALIWQQDTTVLDFYFDGQNLFVLEPTQLSIYSNDAGKLRPRQTLAVTHEHPWPRDLRGRLQVNGFQITASLPGTTCTGTSTPPVMDCRSSDDPWQISQGFLAAFFSPTRNFFTGVLAGQSAGESVPPFFSAAAMQNGGARSWVFAGADGRTRIFLNDISAPANTVNDWGSNITGVQSGCGTGWQVLVTAPGDLNRDDSIQAFEIEGRQVAPVSSIIDMDGPVLALWPGENTQAAHAIVQSPVTGKFEAWSVTVMCN